MEDEEYKKLPVDEKCVHKLWKARVNGYEEVTRLFQQIDDEKSPEFAKYLGLVKKFVIDSNAMGQEKGLEATLAYVENYAFAGKTVNEVMSGIVLKCIAAPKTKTRELALQVTLMYVEIEKQDAVLEELIKGMEQKNPKIVAACISAVTTAIREFGSKIIAMKPLVKKIVALFNDRDKAVRDETKLMVIEMYRWMGPVLKTLITNVQPILLAELEAEFAKIQGLKVVPTRYVRSQQEKQAKLAAQAEEVEGEDEECEEDEVVPVVDVYDLADPVDILSKMPKDFYEKIEAKKWQERREALEAVEKLLQTPKLENGDYGDLVRALKKAIQKDSNVVVVALAGRCLAMLAIGLKKRFQTYASACVSALLEKFKEKKPNVVAAMRDAIDAVYLTTSLEPILDDVLEALNNKNPNVESETSLFLARAFTKTSPTVLNKKLLKALTTAFIRNINKSDPNVREASAECLGTLMKLVGDKAIGPFLVELEKDNLKMVKIRECCDKAVITVKVPGVKKERPATAPVKARPAILDSTTKSTSAVGKAATKRPTGSAVQKKKPLSQISSGTATVVRSKGKAKSAKAVKPIEKELDDDEIDDLVSDFVTAQTISELSSPNWKNRLAAVELIASDLQQRDGKTVPVQAVIKLLARKPGFKDMNFQVLKIKIEIVKYLAENGNFSTTSANSCLIEIAEKFGDAKNGSSVAETMTAIAEASCFGYVSSTLMDFAFTQKSPKVMQEILVYLSQAIKEFGFANLNAKALIEDSKKGLASSNPAVRQAAITLLGTMYLYMGPTLHVFFENEKALLREQINAEFDKYEGEKAPVPIRGRLIKSASCNSLDDDGEEAEVQVNVQDLLPRVDISGLITDAIINELSDKNWKVRNEALGKIQAILHDAKFIKPGLGDLPQALAGRLSDSNVKIAQTSLNICEEIAKAMGAPAKQYLRVFLPGFLQCLGDSKTWMRAAAIETMNAYADNCGYKEFFEGEMIGDALKSGSPIMRVELWTWLAERLPKVGPKVIPKEELMVCLPHLYSNLEDRNVDVRKNAQEAILGVMLHLGYETMLKQTEKVKPASKAVVVVALEKVRPSLPVKPLPASKKVVEKEQKAVRGGGKVVGSGKSVVKPKGGAAVATKVSPVSRKKEEDVDLSPLLVVNNMKHQRTIDESKLKVLKWNFTTPREEFVDLLRDQMHAANINKGLISNMFHSDFRFHIKAIESLTEDLPHNEQALMSNLDLILKWLTLRFFDTNPSVLLKGLEYLHSVFNMLTECQYRLLENEASAFIPYLVLKIGDPKDSVRNGVRALLKQICQVYAISRLFTYYIMEGLKSKNARQRAECLEVLGSFIELYGIHICLPSPASCLKEIAKQISDRDNSVRNAALNCMVEAFIIVGEKIYKMVGNISDKDMSLLEERIKRSIRKPRPKAPDLNNTVMVPIVNEKVHVSPMKQKVEVQEEEQDEDDLDDEENIPPVTLPPQVIEPPKEVSGPYRLDPIFLEEYDVKYVPCKLDLLEFDLDFLNEEVKVPSLSDAKVKIMPFCPPKPIQMNEPTSRHSMYNKPNSPEPKKSDALVERTISLMGSFDCMVACQAIIQMQDVLQSPYKAAIMLEYENDFMNAMIVQLRCLSKKDIRKENVSKMYRAVLTVIDSFYQNRGLGQRITIPVLKDVINEMVSLLVEGRLETCTNGDAFIKVVNVHCVKLIERSNRTTIVCALVKLIHDCVRDDKQPRRTELVMKCLWRVIKLMPTWADDIDYDAVLYEVHVFLKAFPSNWWKARETDTPLRTVKTILHSVVKIKGGTIMLHLGKISNTSESEVEIYILRLLKSIKVEETKQVPLKSDAQKRSLTRANHNMLTDIFQKIGSRDETKEGLTLLYDFMQQHPEADINPFLEKASKIFQDYISRGLAEIELSRKVKRVSITAKESPMDGNSSEYVSKSADYWRDRLQMWNQKWDEVDANEVE